MLTSIGALISLFLFFRSKLSCKLVPEGLSTSARIHNCSTSSADVQQPLEAATFSIYIIDYTYWACMHPYKIFLVNNSSSYYFKS